MSELSTLRQFPGSLGHGRNDIALAERTGRVIRLRDGEVVEDRPTAAANGDAG